MRLDNIIIFGLISISIWYGIWGLDDTNLNRIQYWENVSVVLTLLYTAYLYGKGFFGKKFQTISGAQKFWIITLLVIILFITLPFTLPFITTIVIESDWGKEKIPLVYDVGRCWKMGLITLTAFVFVIIDLIMIKAEGNRTIEFKVNLKYSEIPVFVSCLSMFIFSFHLGTELTLNSNYEPFFSGVVAFQMISSNIIWAFNDDKLFKNN